MFIISTDEDPSLRIESSAIINLRGVSTKLNKYIVFTMRTYKKLIWLILHYLKRRITLESINVRIIIDNMSALNCNGGKGQVVI